MGNRFTDIIQLIKYSRNNAIRAINTELINLYWNIGEHISNKLEKSEWGDSVVTELAKYIQQNEPEIKGFSDKNIWRMKQFYDTYKDFPKLSTLLREVIPRLSENAKHLSLEADNTESPGVSFFATCATISCTPGIILLCTKSSTFGIFDRLQQDETSTREILKPQFLLKRQTMTY